MAHENATPRPWKVLNDWSSHTDRPYQIVSKATGHPVTRWGNTFITAALPTCVDNAALIVEAVNAYGTLRAENERLRSAVAGVIEWDKRRGYIVPYAVRDPLYAALSEAQP